MNNAATTATEPNELYDSLSPVGQDQWDAIARRGYRPDKTEAGWTATKINGDGSVGPCESLVVLYNEVKVIAAGTESQAESRAEKMGLGDAAKVSELKGLGWHVEGAGKEWFAVEQEGEQRRIGPAMSIKALHTQVMLAAGQPQPKPTGGKVHKVDPKPDSQPIIPGTEAAVFADLHAMGVEYRKTTMEILRLQKLQKSQKDALEPLMQKFKDELEFEVNDEGHEERFMTVEVDGEEVDLVLEKEEREVLKTRKHR